MNCRFFYCHGALFFAWGLIEVATLVRIIISIFFVPCFLQIKIPRNEFGLKNTSIVWIICWRLISFKRKKKKRMPNTQVWLSRSRHYLKFSMSFFFLRRLYTMWVRLRVKIVPPAPEFSLTFQVSLISYTLQKHIHISRILGLWWLMQMITAIAWN